MKVKLVSLKAAQKASEAGRLELSPEMLAAVAARYSRSNEGLNTIISKIDPKNEEKSIDNIFKFIDYGHQSIADNVPVAIFMDDISIFLAYFIWSLTPTAGGQEASTRYIKLNKEGIIDAEMVGENKEDWEGFNHKMFEAYERALSFWERVGKEHPEKSRIPKKILEDKSEKGEKIRKRMERNFAFDRARYFLPVGAKTNMMLLMSARGWVELIKNLLASGPTEAKILATKLQEELALGASRMLKHAREDEFYIREYRKEFEFLQQETRKLLDLEEEIECKASLKVMKSDKLKNPEMELENHKTRYGPIGKGLKLTAVEFSWDAIAMAEIRDLNRHRTGTKNCPLLPKGFYFAEDQVKDQKELLEELNKFKEFGTKANQKAIEELRKGNRNYIYFTCLGSQFEFTHVTTADKFIYEAELRTGIGAHYRYAKHLRDVLELWYEKFPTTRGIILEGSAEPE